MHAHLAQVSGHALSLAHLLQCKELGLWPVTTATCCPVGQCRSETSSGEGGNGLEILQGGWQSKVGGENQYLLAGDSRVGPCITCISRAPTQADRHIFQATHLPQHPRSPR